MKPDEEAAVATGYFWMAFSILGGPMLATFVAGVVFVVGLVVGWW